MDFQLWLSAVAFAASLAVAIDAARGWRALGRLRDVPPVLPVPPRLSVIVPARNEASTIEPALRTILALDYPELEVIAIDDRSTDGTGAILDRLREEFASLQVVHIDHLPEGWLGKNHALHVGAARSGADYILFTDADVHYEPSALRRAVAHCEAQGLEHLTLVPMVPARTRFIAMAILGGLAALLSLYRPWRSARTGRHDTGIGAFNLVRADAYRAAGGHAAIAMEILDDIELGRLMGERRRQGALLAIDLVSVEIYRSAPELFRGIQKNAFTFLSYSAWMLGAATAATFALGVWPWIGLVVTVGPARWLNAGAVLATLAMHADIGRRFGYPPGALAYLPVNGVITLVLLWQVALTTWLRGGVTWRGTFYRLAELKARRRSRRLRIG